MEEILISENIIIDEVDETVERLRLFSNINALEIDDVVDFIKTEKYTHFYFDEKMNLKEEGERGVRYLWLDTGLEGSTNKRPIFLSLLSQDGYFIGHYTGDWKFLSGNIASYFPSNTRFINGNAKRFESKYNKKIEKRERKHLTEKYKESSAVENETVVIEKPMTSVARNMFTNGIHACDFPMATESVEPETKVEHEPAVPTDITDGVYDSLMINNWKTKAGLDRYLKVIGCRIVQLVEQNKDEFYILNNIRSAVVNTGLLNQFGADIFVLYRLNITYNVYMAYKIMESKSDYLENGFTKEQILKEIRPINFFDEETNFTADIDDFDVNHRSLQHIIEERRERFPENVRSLSSNTIATKINNALELGLKMQKRDRNYAKPIYSTKTKSISWLMPLHINNELMEEPELVLVVRRNKEFYEIKTIIPYDDELKDRITALSLYNGLW
jgi:hypothetical protein